MPSSLSSEHGPSIPFAVVVPSCLRSGTDKQGHLSGRQHHRILGDVDDSCPSNASRILYLVAFFVIIAFAFYYSMNTLFVDLLHVNQLYTQICEA